MRQTNFVRTSLAVLTGLAAVLFLAMPASAAPQRSQSGGGRPTSSHPAPSGGGGSARPAPSGGGGGSNGGGQSAPAPQAVPGSSGGTTSGTRDASGGSSGATPAGATASRPTSNRTGASGAVVGHAAAGTAGTTVVVPNGYYGGFYPWGYAGLGFGGYYAGYYGYYDPWLAGGGGYYGEPYTTSGYDDGLLRLKVKPRDGMVYVDGYFAGIVDDFDGIFQHLHIEPGAHHIEIMADGYEPLEINVQIQRNRTVTYSGDMKKTQ